jgi:hypothetical protein
VKKIFPSVTGSIWNNSQQKTLTVPAFTGQHACYICPHPTPHKAGGGGRTGGADTTSLRHSSGLTDFLVKVKSPPRTAAAAWWEAPWAAAAA